MPHYYDIPGTPAMPQLASLGTGRPSRRLPLPNKFLLIRMIAKIVNHVSFPINRTMRRVRRIQCGFVVGIVWICCRSRLNVLIAPYAGTVSARNFTLCCGFPSKGPRSEEV